MNIKSLAVLVALSVGSTGAVALEEWQSDTAKAQIKAQVINPLVVKEPSNGNNGALKRVEVDSVSKEKQLDFRITATEGYWLDLKPTVGETNDCHTATGGEHGAVRLTETNLPTVQVLSNFEFIQPVYYVYKAPSEPIANAMCEVHLTASYQ